MKKFSKNYIYYHLVVDFIVIFFLVFCFFTEVFTDEELVLDSSALIGALIVSGIAFVVVYLLKTAYSILYYNTSGYDLKNTQIECQRGVLFKKKSILEYKKIHAVNKKQNLFHKLFKIAVLTLDSGSANTGHVAEILIVESDKEVDRLLEEIKLRQSGNFENEEIELESVKAEKENLYSFTAKFKFLYSLITTVTTLAFLIISYIIMAVVMAFFIKNFGEYFGILLYVALAFMGVSFITFVISALVSFIAYYKFKVYKNENDIEIDYGLLVNNHNTFKFERIKGVVISQNLIQKLFKFVSVKLEVIGYSETANNNNENQSTGMLFPLCKESEVNENIKLVLPNYIPDKTEIKAKKYFPFISWTSFFTLLFSALSIGLVAVELALFNVEAGTILTVVLMLTLSVAVVIAFMLVGGLLEYLNNGITINGDKLTVSNGGFTKKTTVINRKHVIGIEDITTPLRKKAGIYSFKIHFRANDQTNEIRLKNVDESVVETLRKVIIY